MSWLENALGHLKLGLDLIGSETLPADRPAPILSLLCFGTEQLLKGTLISSVWNRTGEYPPWEKIKKASHKLDELHRSVVSEISQIERQHLKLGIAKPRRRDELDRYRPRVDPNQSRVVGDF